MAGAASPLATARGRFAGQGQLAFGVMSAFMQPPPSPRKRKDSTASTASSRASSVSRLGDSSESEDEGGRTIDQRRYLVQIRLDALSCLRALASASPKALHKHWSLFLADSPYLRDRHTLFSIIESDPSRSNRLQACSALEALLAYSAAYLNIAEDRSTKASFTSLSAKLGETLSELHSSLSSLLSRPIIANQADVHLALLSVAAVLAANSPYGRLRRPLAWQLAQACLPLLSSTDSKVVSAAATALMKIVYRYTATASTAPFEWEHVLRNVQPLLPGHGGHDSQAAGWTLLAAIVPGVSFGDWIFAACLLAAQDPSDNVRTAAIRVLGLLAKSDGSAAPTAAEVQESVPTVLRLDPDVRNSMLEAILDVLETKTTGEQAVISAYRSLGSQFGASTFDVSGPEQLFNRAVEATVAGLAHPAAKVRWNAAIAATALLPRSQDNPLSNALFDAVIADSSFKVRIHASAALLSPAVPPGLLPQDALFRLRPSLDRLVADLEDGHVPPKEKQHAEQLAKRLTSLCARLMTT
ncbi:hypothetical protein JCM10296v2_003533 [Rhodotorula toruloides]